MYDNIERELKLLINKQVYDNIMNSYDFHKSIIQTNTYYDTANQDVKKQHGAVRIRTIENKKIFTLKIKKDEAKCSSEKDTLNECAAPAFRMVNTTPSYNYKSL